MRTNKYILLLLFALVSFSALQGQQRERRGRFNVDKMHENKWEFIMKEAKLSPAEVSKIKPIYLEYEKKNWELHKQSRQLFIEVHSKELSDKEYYDLNNKMVNIEIKRAQYMRENHMKLRKLLNSKTLYEYYKAQKNFERQLLRRGAAGPPQAFNRTPPTD